MDFEKLVRKTYVMIQWGPDSNFFTLSENLAHGGTEIGNAASHCLSLSLGPCCGTFGVNQSIWVSLNSCLCITKDHGGDKKIVA